MTAQTPTKTEAHRELVPSHPTSMKQPGWPGEEIEALIKAVAGIVLWRDVYPDGPDILPHGITATITPNMVRAARASLPLPTEADVADMRAFGASDEACYRWPEDTPEHKALRAAFIEGAAGASADRVHDEAIEKAAKVADKGNSVQDIVTAHAIRALKKDAGCHSLLTRNP